MEYRERQYHKDESYENGVSLTKEPCMFSYCDSKTSFRGIMSCGHPVDPNHLYSYMAFQVINGADEITCPYVDEFDPEKVCKRVWKYPELRRMALLDEREKDFFEVALQENKIKNHEGIMECKECGRYVKRMDFTQKIRCQSCKADGREPVLRCFDCKREWKNRRKQTCQNAKCQRKYEKIKLEYNPKKVILGVETESIKQCPSCYSLIEHCGVNYCRNMICPCGYKFCFICLKGDRKDNFVSCMKVKGGCQG